MSYESLPDREVLSKEGVWDLLRRDGYVVFTPEHGKAGFDNQFREHVLHTYFDSDQLQPERYDVFPPDRERARDVVRYAWSGDNVQLEEHDTVTIGDRSYTNTVREYSRINILQDPVFSSWLIHTLTSIPPERRQTQGTFGINLFRTHSDVVSGPHQDDEEFVVVYVVDKHGGGAKTTLYEMDTSTPVYSATLGPGECIIFDDRQFLHDASPLEPAMDGSAPHRDTIVCTVNKPDTYRY